MFANMLFTCLLFISLLCKLHVTSRSIISNTFYVCQVLFIYLFVTSKIVLSNCGFPLAIDFLIDVGSPVSTLCLTTHHLVPVLSHPVSLLSELHQVTQSCRQSKPDKPLVRRPCDLASKLMACWEQWQCGILG